MDRKPNTAVIAIIDTFINNLAQYEGMYQSGKADLERTRMSILTAYNIVDQALGRIAEAEEEEEFNAPTPSGSLKSKLCAATNQPTDKGTTRDDIIKGFNFPYSPCPATAMCPVPPLSTSKKEAHKAECPDTPSQTEDKTVKGFGPPYSPRPVRCPVPSSYFPKKEAYKTECPNTSSSTDEENATGDNEEAKPSRTPVLWPVPPFDTPTSSKEVCTISSSLSEGLYPAELYYSLSDTEEGNVTGEDDVVEREEYNDDDDVDDDENVSLDNERRIIDDGSMTIPEYVQYLEEVHSISDYVQVEAKNKKGGRKVTKLISEEDFKNLLIDKYLGKYDEELSDLEEQEEEGEALERALYLLLHEDPKVRKDIQKINVSTENVEYYDIYTTSTDGIPYILVTVSGDWENFVIIAIYYDGKSFRAYIPENGNCYCKATKAAYGNDAKEELEYILSRAKLTLPDDLVGQEEEIMHQFLEQELIGFYGDLVAEAIDSRLELC